LARRYIELSFNNLDIDVSTLSDTWIKLATQEFNLEEICQLYSDPAIKEKAVSTWKYAAQLGVNDCPLLYFQGKKVAKYPESAFEWQKLLNTIIIL
jgi:hypothetical protein